MRPARKRLADGLIVALSIGCSVRGPEPPD